MPAGVRALAALGVDRGALRAAPFHGVRFVEGDRTFAGRFATGFGLGVRRTQLSHALLEAAAKAGAPVRFDCGLEGWEVRGDDVHVRTTRGELRARVLIGADGLASRVRAQAGLDLPHGPYRFGMRRHFRIAPWSEYVEVHWCDSAEAYVTPVAADEVGVALLWSADGGGYRELLARFPALAERLAHAEPSSEPRGSGPFWQRASQIRRQRGAGRRRRGLHRRRHGRRHHARAALCRGAGARGRRTPPARGIRARMAPALAHTSRLRGVAQLRRGTPAPAARGVSRARSRAARIRGAAALRRG